MRKRLPGGTGCLHEDYEFSPFVFSFFLWAFCLATRFELMVVGAISVVIRSISLEKMNLGSFIPDSERCFPPFSSSIFYLPLPPWRDLYIKKGNRRRRRCCARQKTSHPFHQRWRRRRRKKKYIWRKNPFFLTLREAIFFSSSPGARYIEIRAFKW